MSGTIRINGRQIAVVERKLGRRTKPVPPDQRTEIAQRLDDLGERIARLTVSRRDPERFFMLRSEIADDLRRVADTLRS